MWLYLKNLRTFFCWRFSRKIHFVGFFCVFLVFFIFFHLWLINDRIKGHFHHEGKPVAAKCTFMKIINGQRSFERSKKISPRGQPKCRKMPKLIFWLNHFDQNDDLSSRNGPHGLGRKGQKLSASIGGSKNVIRSPVGDIRKKLIFWGICHYEWLDEKKMYHFQLDMMQHSKQLQQTWNWLWGWGLPSVSSKIALGHKLCQKMPQSDD